MNLTEEQRQRVTAWILAGAKLAEIQSRLASECGVKLTYMEARFLVDDLKLVPKDPEPPKVVEPPAARIAPPIWTLLAVIRANPPPGTPVWPALPVPSSFGLR